MKTRLGRFLPAALVLLASSAWAAEAPGGQTESLKDWRKIQFTDSQGKTHDLWCRRSECGPSVRKGRAKLYSLEIASQDVYAKDFPVMLATHRTILSRFEYDAASGKAAEAGFRGTYAVVKPPSKTNDLLIRVQAPSNDVQPPTWKRTILTQGGKPAPPPMDNGLTFTVVEPPSKAKASNPPPANAADFDALKAAHPDQLKAYCRSHAGALTGGGAASGDEKGACKPEDIASMGGGCAKLKGSKKQAQCMKALIAKCETPRQTSAPISEGTPIADPAVKARCQALLASEMPSSQAAAPSAAVEPPPPAVAAAKTSATETAVGKEPAAPSAEATGKWTPLQAGLVGGAAAGTSLGLLGGPATAALGALTGFALVYALFKFLG